MASPVGKEEVKNEFEFKWKPRDVSEYKSANEKLGEGNYGYMWLGACVLSLHVYDVALVML